MQKISLYARLSCTVSYSDGTSSSFASTVYEENLTKAIDIAGEPSTLGQLVSDGYFNKAIQSINRHMVFCYSGVTDKKITDCSISISGNITEQIKRKSTSHIFGVYGDKSNINNMYVIGDSLDGKPAFAALIKSWIDYLLRGY